MVSKFVAVTDTAYREGKGAGRKGKISLDSQGPGVGREQHSSPSSAKDSLRYLLAREESKPSPGSYSELILTRAPRKSA